MYALLINTVMFIVAIAIPVALVLVARELRSRSATFLEGGGGRLYAATLGIEILLGFIRAIPVMLLAGAVLFLGYAAFVLIEWISIGGYQSFGGRGPYWASNELTLLVLYPTLLIGAWVGFSRIVASLITYWGVNSGDRFSRHVLGAREPSHREEERIIQTMKQIVAKAPRGTKGFTEYFILDNPFEQVNLIGTTLYISSGAVNSDHLLVLLAHEIGHLNQRDGVVILSLRRLVFSLFQMFVGGIRDFSTNRPHEKPELKEFDPIAVHFLMLNKIWFFSLAFWGGGLSVWSLSHHWASYFRERDYLADAFVARLGFAGQLIEYLEKNKFYDTSVPYMMAWRPANELRIDRLLRSTIVPTQRPTTKSVLLPKLEQLLEEFESVREPDDWFRTWKIFLGVTDMKMLKGMLQDLPRQKQQEWIGHLESWIAEIKERKSIAAQAPPKQEVAQSPKDDIGIGDIPDDPDEAMKWLEELAGRQRAPLETLPSISDEA